LCARERRSAIREAVEPFSSFSRPLSQEKTTPAAQSVKELTKKNSPYQKKNPHAGEEGGQKRNLASVILGG